jgi:heme exporter protein D
MLDLDAGKYAAYVWPAYGLTVLVFAGMIGLTLRAARKWRRRAEQDRKRP